MEDKVKEYLFTGYTESQILGLLPKEFVPYKNDYLKECYDIKLKDGRIIENCYPNAGKFNSLIHNEAYEGSQVLEFRLANTPSF